MKSIVATLTVALLGTALVQAGPYIDKNPPIIDVCDCYPPGLQVGGFVGGYFPDSSVEEEALGGGITLGYFFTDRIGLELGYGAYDTEPDVTHMTTLDLIYRLFINDNNCFSPYLIAGGGGVFNDVNRGLFRGGAGVEMRFEGNNCWGLFLDGTFNWLADGGDDPVVARLGVRIPW
tara:strand:- start:3638 stop:4165 length:528 start_codon:yes stop_codon:yes gene_type:complete